MSQKKENFNLKPDALYFKKIDLVSHSAHSERID